MAVLQNNETDSTANYVRLTRAHQHTCRLAFQRGQLENIKIYTQNILLDALIKKWIYVKLTQAFPEPLLLVPLSPYSLYMLWCHVHAWQWHQRSASRPLFFFWCFSSLSEGLVHSSKNTNIAAQLSAGLSEVNFTPGRIKAYNCSGILCYPGHAYSVAGPWARAPCPKPNPQLFTCFFLYPQWILFLFIPVSFPHLPQAWREQRRLISAAEVKRETRAWSWGPGSP